MTRLALGLKWGSLGPSGFAAAVGTDLLAPKAFSASNSDATAIEPSPTPHCRKNQRRVNNRAYSDRSSCCGFISELQNIVSAAMNDNAVSRFDVMGQSRREEGTTPFLATRSASSFQP